MRFRQGVGPGTAMSGAGWTDEFEMPAGASGETGVADETYDLAPGNADADLNARPSLCFLRAARS